MKIGVLMGGISSEKEISMQSGEEILEALKRTGKEVYGIVIHSKREIIEKVKGYDFIFIALHGKFGEDGSVQALLETLEIPYTGCSVLSSALCMDKMLSKKVLASEGISVARGMLVHKGWTIEEVISEMKGFPLIVKPNNGGSSIGASLARNQRELEESVEEALKYDEDILIEEYLEGRELTVPMLKREIFPIIEIQAEGQFFDYTCKYVAGKAREEAAQLSEEMKKRIEALSYKCWDIFKCKGYVRIDIMIKNDEIYVIELNTLPGMTRNSLFPKSAQINGMGYEVLVEQMIKSSLEQ